MTDKVLTAKADGVLTIIINRPQVRNAVDAETMTALRRVLEEAAQDSETRVIIMGGAGGHFCAGADIQDAVMQGITPESVYETLTEIYAPALLAIRNAPQPVIAAVDGYAAGLGCDIALRCDMRLVTARAVFAELFIRVGLIPDGGGTYMLPRLVGLGRAMDMIFTGRDVTAHEALDLGLATRLYPAENFEREVHIFARELASQAPLALQRGKRAILAALEGSYEDALRREASLQREIFGSADGQEGFLAFVEKRKPQWKGK